MCCVGQAADPLQARESIRLLAPDVVTLDVEMPHMDGLEFLRRLMRLRPTPVVMVSSLTARGSEVAIEALALGAVEVVEKPGAGLGQAIPRFAMQLTGAIQKAAQANLSRICNLSKSPVMPSLRPPAKDALVLIGASTGGTEALVTLLSALPAQMPPVLIVQHMPAGFTASFTVGWTRLASCRSVKHRVGKNWLRDRCGSLPGMHICSFRPRLPKIDIKPSEQ